MIFRTDPDRITWTASFLGTAPGITPESIKDYILTSEPKIIIGDAKVVKIGSNDIYVSDHITQFPIQFGLVGDVTNNPVLLNPDSLIFSDYSKAFCDQVSVMILRWIIGWNSIVS